MASSNQVVASKYCWGLTFRSFVLGSAESWCHRVSPSDSKPTGRPSYSPGSALTPVMSKAGASSSQPHLY
ncbi:hypothetical protein RRG08_045003 [Elysia crispata]|uniref:Uncharacterized protein n=1 Tax=Elysia crispata TaxID=231223 RepID=A0AAE0Y4P8_9GAST|nr:hypothetical protein RRG08_045003 [Elysia crispata]